MARKRKPPTTQSAAKQILDKQKARKESKGRTDETLPDLLLVPTPSTLFNLACSDKIEGAWSVGRMVNLIGDSSSGKTAFALGSLAQAAQLEAFDDYRFIYDDVENANEFNLEYLFGSKMAARIEPPAEDENGVPLPSDTIEDFHCNIADALDMEQPFIYVLDSFDALDSEADREKAEEFREARRRGNKAKGSYAMSKPKKASELLRNICARLKKSNSMLIIISQTRDNIDPMSFEKKTRSGGRALKFYAFHEMWLAMAGKIPKKDREVGNKVRCRISKNKLTGRKHERIDFSIYYDYGVDDIRSCIEFMVKEGFWKKTKLTIKAPEIRLEGTMDRIIREVEEQGLERKLQMLVGRGWRKISEELKLRRKRRYE